MVDDLTHTLLAAESDFLTALEGDAQMLVSFNQTWSALLDTLHTKNGSVDGETLSLAHSVASRIAILASCFLDVKREEESCTTSLQRDCDTMLHRMGTLSLNSSVPDKERNNNHCSGTLIGTLSRNVERLSPAFVAPAHKWLLDNLHNPYPTAGVKAKIAAPSSCQISSVNSWFINARRRIGWTTLCREHFSNCRADMIDAAYRALVEEDPQRRLSPKLRHTFAAMKAAAEDLYSSTFSKSIFARDLDDTTKDIQDRREPVGVRKCHPTKPVDSRKMARDSYPSPDRSITASPVTPLGDPSTNESEQSEDVTPPIITGSKRCHSCIESLNQQPSTDTRPMKRLRYSKPSQTHLPSPPSSTDGNELPSDNSSPILSSVRLGDSNAPPPHKPRLSDADTIGMPQFSSGSIPAPPYSTLEPLPYSTGNEYSIDGCFNTDFDTLFAIPPPVDAVEPDFSAPWEVELFRDYCIPEHLSKCPPARTQGSSVATHPSDFDNLLKSIASDTYTTPSESTHLPDITETSYTTLFDSSMPNISRIDWASLLNNSDPYQFTIDPIFGQYPADTRPLPEIDFSTIQLPPTMPTAQSCGDSASKQAKLDQLHAMQEAVRRIEQELQSEGVII